MAPQRYCSLNLSKNIEPEDGVIRLAKALTLFDKSGEWIYQLVSVPHHPAYENSIPS